MPVSTCRSGSGGRPALPYASVWLLAGLLSLGTVLPAFAQTPTSGEDQTSAEEQLKKQELEAINQELADRDAKQAELQARIKALEEESAELSKKLVALASNIQTREGAITAAENRLQGYDEQARKLKKRLTERYDYLAELLAGLQRFERNPPPALAVRPDDALEAVRGAIIMGNVTGALKQEADALSADLANLVDLREKMLREGQVLEENVSSLEKERQEIAALLAEKQKLVAATSAELGEEAKRAKELAAKAASLKDLLGKLESERIARIERQKEEEAKALAAQMQPQIPFTRNKGKVNFPVQGSVIRQYGDQNSLGTKSQGVSIATRAGAQVTAPADGSIKYAGSFRSYGEILILDVGEGYHILLAGLDKLTAQTGQFVRAGEPVGTMGKDAARATLVSDRMGEAQPILYIEFRKNSDTIDPAPWWSGTGREARR